MEMLELPLRRIFAKADGVLDTAVDDKRRELLARCHEVVQRLCKGSKPTQEFFFAHRAVLEQHMGIVALDAAATLRALVLDHEALALVVGPDWIEMVFTAMAHFGVRRAGWLRTLHSVLVCNGVAIKEHQRLVASRLVGGGVLVCNGVAIKEHQRLVASRLVGGGEGPGGFADLMKSKEDWDKRIDLLVVEDMTLVPPNLLDITS
ncbi:hypothetical protein T484DRAFT_1766383 [Baffinella frigidus]|nr:hypothetical protein T484DRAFT_1766383 [Cryptophyta sp. CCMP2293]